MPHKGAMGCSKQRMPTGINTNRDFYKAIAELVKSMHEQECISLEQFLSSLLRFSREKSHKPHITLAELFDLLELSLTAKPLGVMPEVGRTPEYFTQWQATLEQQITDLKQMSENGSLKNELRYFGVTAPSGEMWFNFDPLTYLECGAEGCFGGWRDGDESGREYVPGEVVALNEDGELVACDPRLIDNPETEVTTLSWSELTHFLGCGQAYE